MKVFCAIHCFSVGVGIVAGAVSMLIFEFPATEPAEMETPRADVGSLGFDDVRAGDLVEIRRDGGGVLRTRVVARSRSVLRTMRDGAAKPDPERWREWDFLRIIERD